MGCDIHAHLEYYETQGGAIDNDRIFCYATDISMGRNYTLFNLLAGVRGIGGPVFAARGIPTKPKLSFEVGDKYFMKVLDIVSPGITHSGSTYVAYQEAESLVNSGLAKYYENNKYITNPNWHTPSFLFKKELIEVRRKYLLDTINYESFSYKGKKRKEALNTIQNSSEVELMKCVFPSIECVPLNVTIASMIAIENSGDYQSRFVFWFDS